MREGEERGEEEEKETRSAFLPELDLLASNCRSGGRGEETTTKCTEVKQLRQEAVTATVRF